MLSRAVMLVGVGVPALLALEFGLSWMWLVAGAVAEPVFAPLIHAPHRLRICAIAAAAHVEFGNLQEEYITRAGRTRLRVSFTDRGRRAYRGHTAALRSIIDAAG